MYDDVILDVFIRGLAAGGRGALFPGPLPAPSDALLARASAGGASLQTAYGGECVAAAPVAAGSPTASWRGDAPALTLRVRCAAWARLRGHGGL